MPRKTLLLTLILVTLTGCENYNQRRAQLILSKGWVGPTRTMAPPPLYCYRTIGDVECYAVPLPGQDARLVSAYYPQPVKVCASKGEPILVEEGYIELEDDSIIEPYTDSGPIQIIPL